MRVLVVEDSRTLADAIAEGLQDEGIAVDVAYDGLQAATKIDLNSYAVVVLDRDPFTLEPEQLPEVKIVATMVGGRWVHNPPPWL